MINNKDMIGPALVQLNSVGSVIDVDTMDVYPQLEDGMPDWECDTPLDNINIDWWMRLSIEDIRILQQHGLKPLGMVFSLLTCGVGGGDEVVFPAVPQSEIKEALEELDLLNE